MIGSLGWDGKLSRVFVNFAKRDIRRAIADESGDRYNLITEGLETALDSSNFFVLVHYNLAFVELHNERFNLDRLGAYWWGEF
jgi:hypothetical protein